MLEKILQKVLRRGVESKNTVNSVSGTGSYIYILRSLFLRESLDNFKKTFRKNVLYLNKGLKRHRQA